MKSRLLVAYFWIKIAVFAVYSQEVLPARDTTSVPALPDSIPSPSGLDVGSKYKNIIEAGFRFEEYNSTYNDRRFLYVQYGRRINQVDVFGKVLQYKFAGFTGYQFETETYWKFKKGGYFYFDAAYSDSFILPNYRLRAELFQSVNKFEYSVGVGVVKPFNFKAIPVFTGTIGYYFGDYYVYARPTFSYVDNGFTKSIFVQGRRYFTKTDYIALSLLRGADTGTSRGINSIANQFGNDTYLVRLNGKLKKGRYNFGAGFDYGGIYIPERKEYAQFVGFDIFINREF